MTKFVGIKITAPKKDVFSPIQRYEAQLQSNSGVLLEDKPGRGESSTDVYHRRKNAYPLVLTSRIDSNQKRHALKLADIDSLKFRLSTNTFYRIFLNEQTLISDFTFEPDMVGEYKEIAFNSVPTGWLACDGSAVSRTTYADLFAAIGTNFGVGDGSTTFNLPNRKGRMSVMLDATQTEFNTIGKTGGAKTVTLASSEMPAHVHTFGMLGDSVVHDNFTPGRGSNTPFGSGTTDSTGGGGAHQNLPPYQVGGIVIIKY